MLHFFPSILDIKRCYPCCSCHYLGARGQQALFFLSVDGYRNNLLHRAEHQVDIGPRPPSCYCDFSLAILHGPGMETPTHRRRPDRWARRDHRTGELARSRDLPRNLSKNRIVRADPDLRNREPYLAQSDPAVREPYQVQAVTTVETFEIIWRRPNRQRYL